MKYPFSRKKQEQLKDSPEITASPEASVAVAICAGAVSRSHDCERRLDKESKEKSYNGYVLSPDFVKHERYLGNEESITHLIIIGDAVLGISKTIDRAKISSDESPLESMRVSVLPVGIYDNGSNSSFTVAEVTPSELTKPNSNNIVEPDKKVGLDRASIADITGVDDPGISRNQGKITFDPDGTFRVVDHGSTNGTQIIDIKDFYGHWEDEGAEYELRSLVENLREHPNRWSRDSAGRTVIEDAQ